MKTKLIPDENGYIPDMEDNEIVLKDGVVYPKVPILGSRSPFRICPARPTMEINFDLVDIPKCAAFNEKFVKKYVHDQTWWLQRKVDGHRRVLYKDEKGDVHAYGTRFSDVTGRRENVISKLGPDILRLASNYLECGQAVDGEVYVEGGEATDVPHAMAHNPDRLRYIAFGLLLNEGKPVRFPVDVQRAVLGQAWPWVDEMNITGQEIRLGYAELVQQLTASARFKKWEGWVIKHSYEIPMAKLKLRQTWDLVVTGTTEANYGLTGKFAGQIGALICSAYGADGKLIEVCRCSGMDDETRMAFTLAPPMGCVVEVEGQMIASQGRIRHPQFKRMRTDKAPKDCVWPQQG